MMYGALFLFVRHIFWTMRASVCDYVKSYPTTDQQRRMIGKGRKDVPVVSKFKAIVMHRNE